MIKLLSKSAVLLLIVLSVYFIVHPSACSNMLAGRETGGPSVAKDSASFSEDKQVIVPAKEEDPVAKDLAEIEGIVDTNTLQEEANQTEYSQEDIDYAIASRYVELEREYARTQPVGKDSSREIAFVVMDDFEMSPAEWEGFISRATAADLFNKVRREMPVVSAPATPQGPETVSVQ